MHIVDFIVGSLCLSRFAYSTKSKPIWVEPFWPLGHVQREPETLRRASAGLGEVRHHRFCSSPTANKQTRVIFCGIPSTAFFTCLYPVWFPCSKWPLSLTLKWCLAFLCIARLKCALWRKHTCWVYWAWDRALLTLSTALMNQHCDESGDFKLKHTSGNARYWSVCNRLWLETGRNISSRYEPGNTW